MGRLEQRVSKSAILEAAFDGDLQAIEYISHQALAGNEGAKLIVNHIDMRVASGEIVLKNAQFKVENPKIGLIELAKAAVTQVLVSIEGRMPPVGSTIEEFPTLPVKEAAMLLRRNSRK